METENNTGGQDMEMVALEASTQKIEMTDGKATRANKKTKKASDKLNQPQRNFFLNK